MALIDLETAKSFLDVYHSADDTKIQLLLDSAIDEAVFFIGYANPDEYVEFLESSENPYTPNSENPTGTPSNFKVGALLLLQSNYQASPDDIPKLRDAAEVKLMPLRVNLGI